MNVLGPSPDTVTSQSSHKIQTKCYFNLLSICTQTSLEKGKIKSHGSETPLCYDIFARQWQLGTMTTNRKPIGTHPFIIF